VTRTGQRQNASALIRDPTIAVSENMLV
jgi:hypothetical protein